MGLAYVWRLQVLQPELLMPLRLGIVTTAIAIVLWSNGKDPMGRWSRLQELLPVRLVLALSLVAIAGIPLGLYPGATLAFFRVVFLGLILYMLLTAASVRSRVDLERLMLAHVVGALIFGLFVLWKAGGRGGRLSGLSAYDPNDFAFLLVCTIPLAVYFMRTTAKPMLRALTAFAVVLFVVLLVRTGSRGGFLGFIATMLYLLFRFKGISVRIRIAAIAVGLVTLSLAASDEYWELMGTIRSESDYNRTEKGGRIEVWKRGLGYMKDHPFVGVGLNQFGVAEGASELNQARVAEGKGWVAAAAHNSFIQMGVETGFIGLGLFMALVGASLGACSWRAPPRPTQADMDEQALARALAGALVGFCVAGFFLSQAYSAYLYSLLGMVAGLLKLRKYAPLHAPAAAALALPAQGTRRAQLTRRRG
jgi:O-antigen ligase